MTDTETMLGTAVRTARTLTDAGIPFALAGGWAFYARGGPPSEHDVDVYVKPVDVAATVSALEGAGMQPAPSPDRDDWIAKLTDGPVSVDVIYRPGRRAVDEQLLARADRLRLGPGSAPVIAATDLLIDKLMVLDHDRLDFTAMLRIARELRHQIDWRRVRAETSGSPYAQAFLGLVDDLGISDGEPEADRRAAATDHLIATLRRALAEDPRTAELGVRISVYRDTIVLNGEVSSLDQRTLIEEVVGETVPASKLHNGIRICVLDTPADTEELG
ncbi:BON domain-containing protein [Nocardia stercoris]|uniref:BON domain-containing protein n=1 Tax=Nocardia stercoris TaxID=2483361 RepID=A0A3M2L0T3_9NOCA|nr:BON domain-containing protein [Nocardia stercoris]RMI31302.1 BON domain-containing protein [Nocardia stercoris]